MGGLNRVLLSNLWLFRAAGRVAARRRCRARTRSLRTTTALTVVNAGNRPRTCCPGARDGARQLPPAAGRHAATPSIEHVVRDDRQPGDHASSAADGAPRRRGWRRRDAPGYRADRTHACAELHPDVVVAPALMIGATDSRHFDGVADNVYKFSPVRATPEDLKRFHGTNERISTANLRRADPVLSPADRQRSRRHFPRQEPHHDQRRHRLHRPHPARQELEGRLQHDPRRDARRPRRQGRGRARRHRRRRGRRRASWAAPRPRARPAATSRARSRCAPACRSRPAA